MKKVLVKNVPLLLILLTSGLTSSAFAGNGARHPIEGAMFAKYLSLDNRGGENSKLVSYGSAFILGMYSHLLSDQLGNFEPRATSQEMVYFSAEGIAGIFFLLPEWKKDPRLFWGSLGGMFPDFEHTLRLFGKRDFPTHNGTLTHGEIETFWRGAAANLILNGIAYYVVSRDVLPQSSSPLTVRMGWTPNYWHSQGALENGLPEYPDLKTGSLLHDINLTVDLNNIFSFEICWGRWMRGTHNTGNYDVPGRVVIQSHSVGVVMHPRQDKALIPFVTTGAGVYIASQSDPVNKGSIAFATYRDSRLGVHFGGGIRIPVNRAVSVVMSQRYHLIRFSKEIDGSRDFSGWAGGITLERGL